MISIIIPVYNSEKYIKRAFDSLFTQSIGFNNLEVIFIDDASTDDSPQIIEDYSNKYDNVKSFFLNKNSGAAGKPRNVGLSHATKDYIMFLDSDDYLMDNACEILYNEIIKENIDVVSGCISFDGSNPFVDLWMCILTDPHDSTEIRKKTTEKILNNDFPLLIDSIDDYESIIGDFGFVTKIYKRSLLESNSINFPNGVIAEDSVFLLNVLLNARGIKYVNEIVYCYTPDRTSKANPSMSHVNSKDVLKGLVDSFYKMYLLATTNGKLRIFKQYLLPQKLNYFLISRLFKSDLSVCEILELLIHATALFKLCGDVNSGKTHVFNFISNGDYESVLKVIFGDSIPKHHDIKVISNVDSFKSECDLVELQYDSWLNQFESEKPQLFIYKPDENLLIDDMISYCDKNNIKHILLNGDDFNFNQILDDIKFRYVPYLKHIILFYELNDLNQLNKIINHFQSINYPFKHLKLLTSKENLFLSDTMMKPDLEKMNFDDNYYYCFVDADSSSSLIEIDFDDATFDGYNYENTILNNSEFKQVVNNILSISKPEISVIIPTYNVENYLHNCISSVMSQSYENFEVLCIDDCSTDSTVKIIKQFMESDGRIRLFQNKANMGLEFCRNLGMSYAKGKYIFFLDAEHSIEDNAFELFHDFSSKNELDILLFNLIEESNDEGTDNNFSRQSLDKYLLKIFNVCDLDKNLIFSIPYNPCNKLYSKDFLEKHDIKFSDNESGYENILFFFKCMVSADKISMLENDFYKEYRTDSDSISTDERLFDALEIWDNVLNIFLKDNAVYEYYKSVIFDYIFEFLKFGYESLDEEFKSNFFSQTQHLFEKFAFDYGLFADMIDNLNEDLLDFFEIDFKNPNILPIVFDEANNDYVLNDYYDDCGFLDKYKTILRAIKKIQNLGMFDENFYKNNYDGPFDPLLHYIFIGFKENMNPNERFDGQYYTSVYDSVKQSKLNPLVYLALYGLDKNELKIHDGIYLHEGIDREAITKEIDSFNSFGLTTEKRFPRVIVTLTSFPERLYNLHYTLYSLLTQSFKPDEVVLWLSVDEFPNKEEDIPHNVLNFKNNGLTIKWCEDIKSYKKLIPALNECPNDILVTADDDIFYPTDWLKNLYEGHLKYPDEIICCRCHEVVLNSDNTFAPFNEWEHIYEGLGPSYLVFSTSGAGALYPPNSLFCDVTNVELFQKLSYWNDDMWFWAMSVLNKTKTRLIDKTLNFPPYVNPAKDAGITNEKVLWHYNKHGAYNVDLDNIMQYYPNFLEIILNDLKDDSD